MISKFFKTVFGLLALPLAFGAAKAFYSDISGISLASSTLNLLEKGVLAYMLLHVLVMRPVYLYVLGHEAVHVLATWLCGGKVVSFNVTPSGGNVVTSKTNFFIELSPYFVPLYTILIGLVYFILSATNNTFSHMTLYFIFFLGATLAFHFVMTSEVLRVQQPDIVKSGIIFSLVIIFVGNIIITMAVFCPLFDISFAGFIKSAGHITWNVYRDIYTGSVEFVKENRIW